MVNQRYFIVLVNAVLTPIFGDHGAAHDTSDVTTEAGMRELRGHGTGLVQGLERLVHGASQSVTPTKIADDKINLSSCAPWLKHRVVVLDENFGLQSKPYWDAYQGGNEYLGGEAYWVASLDYILRVWLNFEVEYAPFDRIVDHRLRDLEVGKIYRLITNGPEHLEHARLKNSTRASCRVRALHFWSNWHKGSIDPRHALSPFPGTIHLHRHLCLCHCLLTSFFHVLLYPLRARALELCIVGRLFINRSIHHASAVLCPQPCYLTQKRRGETRTFRAPSGEDGRLFQEPCAQSQHPGPL